MISLLLAQRRARYFVSRIVGSTDAEDVLQDAAVKAIVHAKQFRGKSSYNTWFTRIAINTALMRLRAQREYVELTDCESREPSPEALAAQQERYWQLYEAIKKLTPVLRRAAERALREEEIESNAEKAARFRMRRRLKELLCHDKQRSRSAA